MEEQLKIFVDQLREGKTERLDEELDPNFIECHEYELHFEDKVRVSGETYLADNELIIHLNIETIATTPCTICSKEVKIPVEVDGAYYAIPLEEIKGAVYNPIQLVRESILLEAPEYAECQEGGCPKRKELGDFFKKKENRNHPFSSL